MFKAKAIARLAAFLATVAWFTWLVTGVSNIFSHNNALPLEVNPQVPLIAVNLFLLFMYVFYKYRIERADNVNFIDLLWRVFVTGLITTVISIFFKVIMILLGETALTQDSMFLFFIYTVNFGLMSSVLISSFSVFRRLILYQKSKILITVWKVFHYGLLVSLVYNVLPFPFLNNIFQYYLFFLVVLGLVLSANMKWVAYLNFRQKWKGILLIGLALFYMGYFIWTIYNLSTDFDTLGIPYNDYKENVFFIALIAFIFVYTLFSLLVLLFNLPTSSVFEQKLEEVVNFQKLSQSIQTEQSEDRVYDILLESSVSTVFAQAAWLELNHISSPVYYCYNISEDEIKKIKAHLEKKKVKGILEKGPDKTRNLTRVLRSIGGSRFRSMIVAPVVVKNEQIGVIALLKEVSDGFNREMEQIVSTFANQAGISIENFRLLSEALQNERYMEELKIAKRVQSSLLPAEPESNSDFDIVAFSGAADEVGGDYYDTHKINDHKIALIIGDVSGKGTSAAFHMSQMKGIFQSLGQLNLSPKLFLIKANNALSRCLDKASFITATYFMIDSKRKKVSFARAGHCPTLYFKKKKNKVDFFKNKGLGLGILRNESFEDYIQESQFSYDPGDIFVLYTDGITEAKNKKGEEYGYDRLIDILDAHTESEPGNIREAIIADLYKFIESETLDDDYTIVIVKFN
ncbi:MAG: SpoIIE family protein phosphatase [Cyclobacteriaceae bacterium]|nr:SpoIIE family protein phosphatase [Cyclobacteriaceae bacterium]